MKITFKMLYGAIKANIVLILKNHHIRHDGFSYYLGTNAKLCSGENGYLNIGKKLYLSDGCCIGAYGNGLLSIGNNNFFNTNVNITCLNSIKIGSDNLFGPNIVIVDHNHNYENPTLKINKQGFQMKEISIGSDCWLGANVVILPGVVIGDHIIVGANSVVTKSILEPGVYGGVPAKLIKKRKICYGEFV